MNLVSKSLSLPDWILIVFYFALMLGISLYSYRYIQQLKDYFKGGNRIPWWLSGVSFWMTSFSVAAFVFYPSLCYKYGWVGITLLWVAVPATIYSAYIFGWRWRRLRINSPVEFIEERYNGTLRQIFVWQGVPVKIVDDSLKLFATGKFVSIITNMPTTYSIALVGGIIMFCTFLGGLWAVTITDFIQFIVLSAGLMVILPLSIYHAGGITKIFENTPEGFFHLTNDEFPWSYVIPLIILYAFSWSSINWSLIQRYYCVRDEKEVQKVGLTVILLYIIGPPLMFFPAFAGKLIVPELSDAGDIYPILCSKLLPAGMLGLLISAMFSATMSTLSSDFNVCASVVTQDVYRRLLRPDAPEKELVWIGRISTLLVGILALGIALLLSRGKAENMFRVMVTLFGVATGPVAVPVMLGMVSRRYPGRSAVIGFCMGTLVGLFLLYIQLGTASFALPIGITWIADKKEWLLWGLSIKMEIFMFLTTTIITYLFMEMIALVFPVSVIERNKIGEFFEKIENPIGNLDEDKEVLQGKTHFSPYNIVGMCTILIAIALFFVIFISTHGIERYIGIAISFLSLIGGILFIYFGALVKPYNST
ncbi:MAG: sodium:solute symporter family transporter [Candidatus Hydrogenedens sp.]